MVIIFCCCKLDRYNIVIFIHILNVFICYFFKCKTVEIEQSQVLTLLELLNFRALSPSVKNYRITSVTRPSTLLNHSLTTTNV